MNPLLWMGSSLSVFHFIVYSVTILFSSYESPTTERILRLLSEFPALFSVLASWQKWKHPLVLWSHEQMRLERAPEW